MGIYRIKFFVPDFLYLIWCLWNSSMLWHIAAVYLFPLMDGILSYEYTTMYLPILPLLFLWRYDWCCNDKHSCNAFCYTFTWISVGYKHRSVIPGSKFVHGESSYYKTVFQTHINWCSHQHQLRVLTVPTPCWYLVLPFCLI